MNNPWPNNTPDPEWLTPEIKMALQNNNLPFNRDGMLMLWQNAEKAAKNWKERELEYRKACVTLLVPEKTEGTNTIELGEGYKAKAAIKYNYTLDNDNDRVWAALEKIESLGNEGPFIAKRLVSWTPNFLLTEYRQLQEDADKGSQFAKSVITELNTVLTIKDAAPTLAITEPKAKKK